MKISPAEATTQTPKCLNCIFYADCSSCFEELPQDACTRYEANKFKAAKPQKIETICWDCARLDCSWIKNSEPVAGWEAVPTYVGLVRKGVRRKVQSYRVISCPGYAPGKDVGKGRLRRKK